MYILNIHHPKILLQVPFVAFCNSIIIYAILFSAPLKCQPHIRILNYLQQTIIPLLEQTVRQPQPERALFRMHNSKYESFNKTFIPKEANVIRAFPEEEDQNGCF